MKMLHATALAVLVGSPFTTNAADFPSLPSAITSFGACVEGDFVYVYGGHTGEAHQYSLDTTSFDLLRARIDGTSDWEALPGPARAQGASLVSWEGRLIRVGGLSARNETLEDEEELRSLTDVAMFDPESHRWSALPELPSPRSSHDSVVVDGKLYVLGGWELSGTRQGEWLEQAWVMDLNRSRPKWKKIDQPFKRRAVAVEALGNSIIVMGGMDSENDTSRNVDIYNIDTRRWSEGPKLPDGPMDGFGAAACVIGDTLYASTYGGKIFSWNTGDTEWAVVAEPAQRRFFHRMVPASDKTLLMIAGASRKEGHMASVEVVNLSADIAAAK